MIGLCFDWLILATPEYSATRWRGSTVFSHLNENRPIEALIDAQLGDSRG
jgi:hypothetical protein